MEIALLHLRFTAALKQKIVRVMDHRGHIQASIDNYQKMGIKMEQDPEFGFSYPGSVKFESPRQFIDRSMIGPNSLPPR
jgi:hypothetical protein